jgi:BMFP domain-containing protein YqiC
MQTDNRLFDDIARAANGALGALSGVRNEIEAQLRGFLERWLKAQNLVTREEFEVVKEMASRARAENEALAAKVAALEAARTAAPPSRD